MNSLKNFITAKLSPVLPMRYVNILTDESSMTIFKQSFTSPSVDPEKNYEFYEQMGDVSANKFLVYYFYRRFPVLMCPLGVKVVARLKINYGSKQTFSRLAEKEGFWDYISASEELKSKRKTDLLEDVFESFVGTIEFILDNRVERGLGAIAAEKYLTRIFDAEHISLDYNDLYDSKTRLKELLDKFKTELGKIKYTETKEFDSSGLSTTTSRIVMYPTRGRGKPQCIGIGSGRIKSEAQRSAAEEAILHLKLKGFYKQIPEEYERFRNTS